MGKSAITWEEGPKEKTHGMRAKTGTQNKSQAPHGTVGERRELWKVCCWVLVFANLMPTVSTPSLAMENKRNQTRVHVYNVP